MTKAGLLAATMLAAATAPAAQAGPLLHPMFQDHAVLQRDAPVPVYGDAAPGAEVTVTMGAATQRARAGADGHWTLTLPAMPAGGPFTLQARSSSGETQAIADVLVGDVFLCSGQSNMAFAVKGADNAAAEMAAATDGTIRSLTVRTKDSVTPLDSFADPVAWTPASPETVGDFSASCYFFARELKKTEKVPVGLVTAAWGGSRVRAWISEPTLHRTGQEAENVQLLDLRRRDPMAADRGWSAVWERWWRQQGIAGGEPWQPSFDASGWETAPAGLGPWALWKGTSPDGFTGQMWFRTEVTLTAAQAAQGAILDLGAVNEEDQSWVNGQGVGGTSWSRQARHPIPAGVLRAGKNVIVTNIFCSWRNCGMSGPADSRAIRLADGSAVPIAGPWRYAEMPASLIAPQLPWGPAHGVSVISNGMIAPMGPYGFKAAVWYQGESDIHFAPDYQALLGTLMADWRRRFRADLPFLIVQLPNFGPRPDGPVESEMADIREAQRRAAIADPKADYIVTIDIGNPADIHPTAKQEVGRRLALAGRRLLYGEATPTGPRPIDARIEGKAVTLRLGGVTGALAAPDAALPAFELCGPAAGSCRIAPARIAGADTVAIDLTGARPTRLRYCWGDSPVCPLSDGSKLPTGPFEIPVR
ncbi:sialate O-acetylesterase [Sphingobium ummariense]|uniref:Sialate O-acetylesterase domain-containing protein n=1 Tax=Sphingobium ummariense RL-3 TaxID=1346791 RepID=T0JAE9_9SPHN|nr:sialate O-acetylesterase [Sphingobium ummariense]EQB33787.1 hypothetical protein M529_01915 [Sphingobium ummariense RL-3]